MLLFFVRDFMLRFWLKSFNYKIIMQLILIVVFFNPTQILLEVTDYASTESRFIIAARKCSVKPLCNTLTSILR